jgi:putative endonuclease
MSSHTSFRTRWCPEVLVARKDDLGRRGEECAANYLANAGYQVLARNWRCSQGEIDLITTRDGEVVFVEVKTRSGLRFGHPFEAITVAKLARLRRLAAAWCGEAQAMPAMGRSPRIRIDVVGVIAVPGQEPVIEHLEGVF